jgi:protease-4
MRLILFFLKCLVGLLASIGLLIVLAGVGLGLMATKLDKLRTEDGAPPETMVLMLDISPGVLEAQPDNPLARAALGHPLAMIEVLEALEAAADDPRVAGLFLRAGRGPLGMAQVQELRDAIADFRDSGKPVTAFAESFGEGGDAMMHFYLVSAAGEVWMQPSGDLGIVGFAFESPFLKSALDEIGVEPQIAERKEYKGAASSITEDRLPEAQRRNLQRLVDSWLEQWIDGTASARGLSPETLSALIDRGPLNAEAGLEARLVDRLGYWDEVADAALSAAGAESDFFGLKDYHGLLAEEPHDEDTSDPVVALVQAQGPIVLGNGQNDPVFGTVTMGSDDVASTIAEALEDPEVKAILVRVDSPGGSYVASDAIWREVRRARDMNVPVIVSMGNIAASGGYFLAAPAAGIVAQPGTVTGSIGVVAGKVVLQELWAKLDISWDGVAAGRNARLWSANHPFDEAGWDHLNRSLDETYADFTAKVADGRGLATEQVEAAAGGRVWSGADAMDQGLVDRLGGYREAIALAKERAGIDPDAAIALTLFPEPRDPWQAVFQDLLSGDLSPSGVGSLLASLARVARAFNSLDGLIQMVSGETRPEALRAPEVLQRD